MLFIAEFISSRNRGLINPLNFTYKFNKIYRLITCNFYNFYNKNNKILLLNKNLIIAIFNIYY